MFEERKTRTELSELGEFKLIDIITNEIKLHHSSTLQGVGDDAAILKFEKDDRVLVSTDLLVEGVHFNLAYAPLKHLGYKAAVVNFSDIAAMNAVPTQITVGLAVSNRFSLEAVQELYEGIRLACDKYKVDLVGGDTTSSTSGMMISVTVLGKAKEKKITKRSTAKAGDLLVTTGDLGSAYAGLLLLERERKVYEKTPGVQPEFSGFEYLLERQLKPEARVDMVRKLKEVDIVPTSMIDISDGLASEILHICKDSKLGCHLYENKIPIDTQTSQVADLFEIHPTTLALSGGEDYELLMTIKQDDYEKIKDNGEFIVIGHMMDEGTGAQMINAIDQAIPIRAQGWDGLKKS
ncbi:MAG: thiamine-phosphate kinase [Bacteroidales bacterium]|nr:thiamine-phosphate kinase [Bacteroidales bacterium]